MRETNDCLLNIDNSTLGLQFLLPDILQNSNINLTLPTSAFGSDESIIAVPDPNFRKEYDIEAPRNLTDSEIF